MALLHPTRVSTERFAWLADLGTFAADLSDLGPGFGFGRVYDDACDAGLTLTSTKTGREIIFAIEREQRDSEGELQLIELRPAPYQRGLSAREKSLKIHLFND